MSSAPVAVYWAPPGTDPRDTSAWKPLGVAAAVTFDGLVPVGQEPVEPWRAPGPATWTFGRRFTRRMSWWKFHLLVFQATHPAARRAKTEYRRRRR